MSFLKNKNLQPIFILSVFCLIIFFGFIWAYPLIDVDETRYVRIAQEMMQNNDFLTPMINGEKFLEKPPLYFWLECLSFGAFGTVTEWAARIPMAIVASFGVFMTYYFGKKFISQRFGLISAAIVGSNIIYIVLSHIAILDLLLSVTMMVSVYFGLMTLFSTGKDNWLQWLGFYGFCALSVLSKGLPGLIIPFGVVFFAYLCTKRVRELFDFRKIGLGLLILLLVILPWHIMMYKAHGQEFISEYIIKHHIARFVNSEGINRKEPFIFYIPVILVGFIPFVFTLLSVLCSEIKKTVCNFKTNCGFKFNLFKYFAPDVLMQKRFLNINIMAFLFIFLFFSASSTKLPTYILPTVFPLAFITAYIFDEYLDKNKFETQIRISNIILSSIFGLASIAAIVCACLTMVEIFNEMRPLLIAGALLFGSYSVYNFVKLKKSQLHFITSTVAFMMVLTIILCTMIFNFVVSFGQADLINYAKYAKQQEKKLATYNFGNRYSTIYYYGDKVAIQREEDDAWFEQKLNDGYLVILKNKNMVSMSNEVKYEVIQTGKKYSLVSKPKDDIDK